LGADLHAQFARRVTLTLREMRYKAAQRKR
jgi:hypothetical protein